MSHNFITGSRCFPFGFLRLSALLHISLFIIFALCVSCGKQKKEVEVLPMNDSIESIPKEDFHADNDIAMTLLSITDAIKEGEALDSVNYDYEGILTDGTGRPLYTDIQGAPGVWQIKVLSPETLIIRNLYLGDLLPEALENYIIQCLGFNENNIIDVSNLNAGETSSTSMYNFPGGYLRFDTTTSTTPAGQEGPLVTITAAAGLPETD